MLLVIQDSPTDILLNEIPDKEQLCGLINSLIQDGADVQAIFDQIRTLVIDKFEEIEKELIKELKDLHGPTDQEIAHTEADDLLLTYIDDPEITDAFKKIKKWYS